MDCSPPGSSVHGISTELDRTEHAVVNWIVLAALHTLFLYFTNNLEREILSSMKLRIIKLMNCP